MASTGFRQPSFGFASERKDSYRSVVSSRTVARAASRGADSRRRSATGGGAGGKFKFTGLQLHQGANSIHGKRLANVEKLLRQFYKGVKIGTRQRFHFPCFFGYKLNQRGRTGQIGAVLKPNMIGQRDRRLLISRRERGTIEDKTPNAG